MNTPSHNYATLIAHYRALVDAGAIYADAEQRLVAESLSLLATRLQRAPVADARGGFARALFGWGRERTTEEPLRGLYIYGSVGRGKSMLMQLFVDQLPEQTYRVHFHEFMQWVHKRLNALRTTKIQDPIQAVALEVAARARVLCLDEMQIENIADAMIIGRLFETLFAQGVLLVTTSNRHPNTLYHNGLNRHRFVPFIELIEAKCDVIDLAGTRDYRFENAAALEHYYIADPVGFDAKWQSLAPHSTPHKFKVSGREWVLDRHTDTYGWTSFAEACETPRGAADYDALTKEIKTLFLAEIPVLDAPRTSAITRFVTLIDILYEAGTQLYLDLPTPLDQLHSDPKTGFVFDRTLSRLVEMAN